MGPGELFVVVGWDLDTRYVFKIKGIIELEVTNAHE